MQKVLPTGFMIFECNNINHWIWMWGTLISRLVKTGILFSNTCFLFFSQVLQQETNVWSLHQVVMSLGIITLMLYAWNNKFYQSHHFNFCPYLQVGRGHNNGKRLSMNFHSWNFWLISEISYDPIYLKLSVYTYLVSLPFWFNFRWHHPVSVPWWSRNARK